MNPNLLSIRNESLLQTWGDLVPLQGSPTFDDPYARLSSKQMYNLRDLNRIVWLLKNGKEDPNGPSAHRAGLIRQAFAQDGLDADWLLSQREVIRQQRVEQLFDPKIDGQSVRLLGQSLPLKATPQHQLTQFLLTPALPGCSHVAPPPPHLVTQVEALQPIDVGAARQAQGSTSPALWVEGTVRFALTSHSVFRVCGMMQIGATYRVEPTRISPATTEEVVTVFDRPRQEEEATPCPSLMDSIGDG